MTVKDIGYLIIAGIPSLLLLFLCIDGWIGSKGLYRYTCRKCGHKSRPRDDRRWYKEISGSGPETCEEYWAHDCDGER